MLAHQHAVFALISRVTGKGPHVADLAQETFLRAYRAFPSFDVDGAAAPLTWLLTIAVRLALNARKQTSRVLRANAQVELSTALEASTPETERERRELGAAIERAARELSDEQRAVFVLAEFHGLSLAEIASALGAREGTVKTRLFRAREKLRQRLSVYEKGWRQ